MRRTLVVCGATGQQGRAVVRHLLANPSYDVVAISRAPEGTASASLERAGARVMYGDLLDRESLLRVFRGADGVFGVTQPWSRDYKTCDVVSEIRQGQNIVMACRNADVRHLVLSTAFLFQPGMTGMPHVDSKIAIEEYAWAARVPLTIVRPASFMENIGSRFFPVRPGSVRGFVAGDAKVPYIACDDIGGLVSVAFARPKEFMGCEVAAIGDFVSGFEIADMLSRRYGQPFRYTTPPAFLMRLFAREFYTMRRAFERYGRAPYPSTIRTSLDKMRQLWPAAKTMESFVGQQKFFDVNDAFLRQPTASRAKLASG